MARVKCKVQGYIVMEGLFAMVIVMLSFSAAILIFNTMTENQRSYMVVKAEIALRSEAERCKADDQLFSEDIPVEGFTIQRRVFPYRDSERLMKLELKAITAEGKILSEYYELVLAR